MATPAFATRFPDGVSPYTGGDTTSQQSATAIAVSGISGFATGTAMQIALPANNADGTPTGTPASGASAPSGNYQRCEVAPNLDGLGAVSSDGDLHNGATGYFGLAIKLSSSFPTNATSWQVCTQFKNDGTGSPPLEVKIGNGYLYLDGNSGSWSTNICSAAPGGVYGIVLGITFTESASTSTISVWVNGTKYLTNFHPTGAGFLYSGVGDYWKTGIYRDSAITPAATIWYGGLAHDTAYQPVADYITATLTASTPTTSSDTATGAEQGSPADNVAAATMWTDVARGAEQSSPRDTTTVSAVVTDTARGATQGTPAETKTGGYGDQVFTSTARGAEQGTPAETQTGGAISNIPVATTDYATGQEGSNQADTWFSGTRPDAPAALPVVVVPPTLQGAPGAPAVPGPQHFAWPFTLSPSGSYATVDQDSPDDVTSCVRMLLGTRPGELIEVPEFGAPDLTFMGSAGQEAALLESAVTRWEPRAAGAHIPVVINEDGTASVQVGVPTRPGGPAV